jgi:tetratricopeptide (TPR) repeat protein
MSIFKFYSDSQTNYIMHYPQNRANNLICLLLLFLFFAGIHDAVAQHSPITDSVTKLYKKEQKLVEKARLAGELSQIFMAIDTLQSDYWGGKALEDAEISRDRKAMHKANLDNGIRYSYITKKKYMDKSLLYLNIAYKIAKDNKLEKEQAETLLWQAYLQRNIPDIDKSLTYTTQAFAVTQGLNNDSLLAACYLSFSNCYNEKDDKLLMLKNVFEATTIAERIDNLPLKRNCYLQLSDFYASTKNYDKALDYAFKVLELDSKSNSDESKYGKVTVYNTVGGLYVQKKNFPMAQSFYEKAINYADTINFPPLKMQGFMNLLSMYLSSEEPQKALHYFNNKPELKQYFINFGMESVIDQAYGVIYTNLNKLDSASYHYSRCLPFFENTVNASSKLSFYYYYGDYLMRKNDRKGATAIFEKGKQLADETKNLGWMRTYSRMLDTSYSLAGNYAQALYYNKLTNKYKDSLDKLGKEDEILQLQITDEEKRRERDATAEKEKIEKRNRIQYMAIIIAIAALFVGLVLLGFLRVSATTIRIIGFFAFLMFFEFIFLVFKKSIYGITQGEPWKDLGMMILIAALLVPLHHWVEHRVIHYLSSQHMLRLRSNSRAWWSKLFQKEKQSEVHH